MKSCRQCSAESADELMSCATCGAAFPASPAMESLPLVSLEPPPRVLGAGYATLILFAFLAAQVLGGVVGGLLAIAVVGPKGLALTNNLDEVMEKIMPPMVLVILILSAIATVSASVALLRGQLQDAGPTGAAWVRGRWRDIGRGLAIGIIIAACWSTLAMGFGGAEERTDLGPLARMATTPGAPQISWVIAALLLAPPVEELLFRGILYGGYRKSFGPITAAIVSTLIFVLLHLTEAIHFPLAIVGLITLSLAALWCRLQAGAIGPAIAVHLGYNSVIAFVVLYGS